MDELLLEIENDGEPTEKDLKVITALILLQAANSQDSLSSDELMNIVAGMFRRFGVGDEESGELIFIAELIAKDTARAKNLIERINQRFSVEQKQQIMALAWRVIGSDNVVSNSEGSYIIELRKSLKLTAEQSAFAREIAEEELTMMGIYREGCGRDSDK